MTLDVVIPTFNRAFLLPHTLDSLANARCPSDLEVTVIVVDNNSTDNTREAVERYQAAKTFRLRYLFQPIQGRSAALNTGIDAGCGEVVAMIDDDEEIGAGWFEVIFQKFCNCGLDFIGGPSVPRWAAEKPSWISKEFGSIVGWVDGGTAEQLYGPGFNAMLMGGNAVIRRTALEHVGAYNTNLGRTDRGLLSCEDEEMFQRLLECGFKGMYVPDLVIYHYVPPERMTRRYHRRWCWGRGTSLGLLTRTRHSGVTELFGIPRWKIRHAAVGFFRALKGALGLEPPQASFEGELRMWDLAGYINGRFFRNV